MLTPEEFLSVSAYTICAILIIWTGNTMKVCSAKSLGNMSINVKSKENIIISIFVAEYKR
jgi:hypothetical protein